MARHQAAAQRRLWLRGPRQQSSPQVPQLGAEEEKGSGLKQAYETEHRRLTGTSEAALEDEVPSRTSNTELPVDVPQEGLDLAGQPGRDRVGLTDPGRRGDGGGTTSRYGIVQENPVDTRGGRGVGPDDAGGNTPDLAPRGRDPRGLPGGVGVLAEIHGVRKGPVGMHDTRDEDRRTRRGQRPERNGPAQDQQHKGGRTGRPHPLGPLQGRRVGPNGPNNLNRGRGIETPRLGRCDQRKRDDIGASATVQTVRRRPAEGVAADKEGRSRPGASERPAAVALLLNQTPMLCSVSRSEMARNDPSGETPARAGGERPGRN